MIACICVDDMPAVALRMMRYRDQEVAVVARQRVLARTLGLAKRGLRIGESQDRAAVLFPEAVFTSREPHVEQAAWYDILERCHQISPYVAQAGPGVAYADVQHHQHILDLCTELNVRAGVAPTRTAALLAGLRADIGTVRIVRQDTLATMLAEWPVELLASLNVQSDTINRLQLFGLRTLAQLQQLTRRHLVAQFGNDGLAIFSLLASIGDPSPIPLYQPPPTIEYITYLDPAQREPNALQAALRHTVDMALRHLHNHLCGMVELRVTEHAQPTVVRASRLLKTPTNTPEHIHTVATILLRDIVAPKRYCTSLTVVFRHLQLPTPSQIDLFTPSPTALDVARMLIRRFPSAMRRIDFHTPEAYLPELSHSIVPLTIPDATDP
jgi:hypothetical protein